MNDATPTPPLPGPPDSAPPTPARHLGGLPDLILFFVGAVALFLLVQAASLSLLLYDAHRQNPRLTWHELSEQVAHRVQFNAFFAVPVQLVYYALLLLLLYALVTRRGLPFWSGLALRPLPLAQAFPALAAGVVLALLIQFANALVPPPEPLPFDRLFSSRAAAWLIVATSLLAAPAVEELIFRGYIYTLLERLWGMTPAVVLSGVLFGSIHFAQLYPGYFQMLLLCLVGLVFSLARARTGTVLASILLHFGYNASISVLFLTSDQFRQLAALH